MSTSARFARASTLFAFSLSLLAAPAIARADPPKPPAAPPPTFAEPKPCCGPCAPNAAPATPPVVRVPTTGPTEEPFLKRGDGTEIHFYRTNFVTPGELIQAVTTLVRIPDLSLKDIPRSNQIAMQGPHDAIETGLEVFAYFDVADPQVFVECKIVELTYDSNFEFGFSGILDRNKAGPPTIWRGGSALLSPPTLLQAQQPGASPFQGGELAFGFVGKLAKEYGAMDLKLDALQRDGTAEILSRPSIVATQGQRATVSTSQKISVIQVSGSSLSTVAASAGETVNFVAGGIEAKIGMDLLPQFIGDGYLTMWVKPTVADITGFSQGPGGTSAPILAVREAETVVTIADGDTLIIGGLYTSTTLSDKAKVPFLSDIPGLGKLFTRVKDQKVKTELVFFITPHILRKKTDYRVIVPPGEAERLRGACDLPAPGPADATR